MALRQNPFDITRHLPENQVQNFPGKMVATARLALGQRLANQPQAVQKGLNEDKVFLKPGVIGEENKQRIRPAEVKAVVKPKTVTPQPPAKGVVLVSDSAKYLSKELELPILPANIPDIDEDDFDHLEFCPGLVKYAYAYLYRLENTQLVTPGFLAKHTELRPTMRCILIDWLVAVQQKFKLLQETLFISVMYLDRFLSDTQFEISRQKLQLVGVACMLIACKYEEMYLPSVSDFVYMCDNAYRRDEILRMERKVLCALKFELGRPISSHFLRRYSKAAGSDSSCHTIAKYLMEVALYDYELASEKPSIVAASSLLIAGKVTECVEWDETVQFYSNYTVDDLKETASKIARLANGIATNKHMKATYKKYSHERFCRVADICLNNSALRSFIQEK